MNLPHPHLNVDAKKLLRLIYRNDKINVQASIKSLDEQLDLYLDHLRSHIKSGVSKNDRTRIIEIIERNNEVAELLESPEYKKIIKEYKEILTDVSLGLVFCIDGRIPTIFIGGRFARHWEVPAGEIAVTYRKSDKAPIPHSDELSEALRKMSTSKQELLEIVFAHTSLLNPHHGCGAMAAKKQLHLIDPKIELVDSNLDILKKITIPALTNLYNEFRHQSGYSNLKTVAIPALYDTDTFGIILNYDLKDKSDHLSSSELTNKYQDQISQFFLKQNLIFGVFGDKFCELKYFILFSQHQLTITKTLLSHEEFKQLRNSIIEYINDNFSNLTEKQKKALLFVMIKNIAFQFLTGTSAVSEKNLFHSFVEHEESYMAISIKGTTIGKFDPATQAFASSPEDAQTAIKNINTKISIMDKGKSKKPYILFVCNPVSERVLSENSITLQRVIATNSELFRAIIYDEKLGKMIENEELIVIPILIAEYTREVLKIIDHSAYI